MAIHIYLSRHYVRESNKTSVSLLLHTFVLFSGRYHIVLSKFDRIYTNAYDLFNGMHGIICEKGQSLASYITPVN